MEVLIGWTGSPASSPHLVSEVKRLKSDPSFMEDSLINLIHVLKILSMRLKQIILKVFENDSTKSYDYSTNG